MSQGTVLSQPQYGEKDQDNLGMTPHATVVQPGVPAPMYPVVHGQPVPGPGGKYI